MIGAQLQKAIADALKGANIAAGRIYDTVPDNPTFPYVTIGDEQVIDDGNSCSEGWEIFADVHVWSRKPGFPEAKGLIADIVPRIKAIESVFNFIVVSVEFQTSRMLRDTDGKTSHGVATFRILLDQA